MYWNNNNVTRGFLSALGLTLTWDVLKFKTAADLPQLGTININMRCIEILYQLRPTI